MSTSSSAHTWSPSDRNRPHHDIKVWQLGKQLVLHVYRVTRDLPDEETYGLQSQLRRAAVSIPSNIAEGAARGSQADFLRFLYMARGSLEELDTQMEIASDLGYFRQTDLSEPERTFEHLDRALGGLVDTVKSNVEN